MGLEDSPPNAKKDLQPKKEAFFFFFFFTLSLPFSNLRFAKNLRFLVCLYLLIDKVCFPMQTFQSAFEKKQENKKLTLMQGRLTQALRLLYACSS